MQGTLFKLVMDAGGCIETDGLHVAVLVDAYAPSRLLDGCVCLYDCVEILDSRLGECGLVQRDAYW